ncbi:hypothetical protein SBI_06099 [Streptomyces bingchenggensis BCW-1]|uniref:Uncharacterized protein n=1 Tax=Streptomyces bingchenggensis (strain BCW-1) TaxID=749414 RepID=D7BQK2_STRBB|nr:hypothetical protein SBI_06099 [Streptomyces bingchenggensis BCW-1]
MIDRMLRVQDHCSSDFMILRQVVEITKTLLHPVSQITYRRA